MREFTVGGVLRRVIAVLRARPWLLLGLAALFIAVPHALLLAGMRAVTGAPPAVASAPFVVDWLGGLFLQAAVVRVAIDEANRQSAPLAELLKTAARFFFPLLAISFLSSLAIGAASILLVFPGFMLFCRWFVVVPVVVAERSGISAAFTRSAALTNGVRWRLFGALLVFGVFNFVLGLVLGGLGGLASRVLVTTWPLLAIGIAVPAITTLINAAFYAAAYLELREIREGVMAEDLVSVFS